jgi:deferrochelatase/peroxidase EfeB
VSAHEADAAVIEFGDIQGLVRFGHGQMPEACFFLLAIVDPAAARAWLKTVPLTSAAKVTPAPKTAIQVAFTWAGLRNLGLPRSAEEGFSAEYMAGMAGSANRSRRLGDLGTSDPRQWAWGRPGTIPDVLVMLYAQPGLLTAWKQDIKGPQWPAAFREMARLSTSQLDGVEPFGFKDGISEPTVDWDQHRRAGGDEPLFGNLLALGEFLLGYRNEYAKYTERPFVNNDDDPQGVLPAVEGDARRRDFGRNGTYLVFRDLEQDVRGFWQFLDAQAGGDRDARRRLAAAMVGRTMDGESPMPFLDRPIPGIDPHDDRSNRFTYDSDVKGHGCPLGAHVRRSNPRTADYPPGATALWSRLLHILGFAGNRPEDDLISSARFHRILRRGREYGEGLSPDEAAKPGPPDAERRGLRFICLNANIARQFEFVQNAWIMGTSFAGLTEESDALVGNRTPTPGGLSTDTFCIPQANGLTHRISGVPQFVTVRGGAYFFLPSLRAVRYLASLSG